MEIDMLRSPRAKYDLYCFRSHQSVREQVIRPYRQITFCKITVDIITLFCNMLQLPGLLLPTIDLASGVDCNICNHFFADEFRPLDVDISKYFCMSNKVK